MGARSLLLIVAVVLFALSAFNVDVGDISLVALGLAAFAASFLIGDRPIARR